MPATPTGSTAPGWPARSDVVHVRAVAAEFRGLPLLQRARGSLRLGILPLEALRSTYMQHAADTVGPRKVLSLGPGLGAVERYLGRFDRAARFYGIEVDEAAVRGSDAAPWERFSSVVGDVRDDDVYQGHVFDAVLAVDVFHHIPEELRGDVLHALLARLRPGGAIVVKDINGQPSWKARVNQLHDRIVAGDAVTPVNPTWFIEQLATHGATARVQRCDRWSPYSHVIISATTPGVR